MVALPPLPLTDRVCVLQALGSQSVMWATVTGATGAARHPSSAGNGGWQVNGKFMNCTVFRFAAQDNEFERWIIQNNSGGWQHPVHIHFEEFRILSRNGVPVKPGAVEFARKDVNATGLRRADRDPHPLP